jgi:hypothetical protein
MNAVVDVERWPLVFIRPPSGVSDDSADLDAYYRALEQVITRRRPYVVLYDVRGVKMSAGRRSRLRDWTNLHDSSIRVHLIALAVVVSSQSERAEVTAGFWSLEQSFHARIFDDVAEAERWLLGEFARGEGAN